MKEHEWPTGGRFVSLGDAYWRQFVVEMSHQGRGGFSIEVDVDYVGHGERTLVESEGPWTGRAICTPFMSEGQFELGGDGSWQMRLIRPDDRWSGPGAVQGIGDASLTFSEPATAPFIVEAEFVGDGPLHLEAVAADGEVLTGVANVESGKRRRMVYLDDREVSTVRVHAHGAWRLNVNELFHFWYQGWGLSGTSDGSVLRTFPPGSGHGVEDTAARFVHEGAGRVTLTAAGPYGQRRLVDAEGGFDGVIDVAADARVLVIWADGDWSIDPVEQ